MTFSGVSAETGVFTISFSEPVNPNEFGIAMNFAEHWTLDWAEDAQQVTVTVADKLTAGESASVIIFRLRDLENNMIGQDGVAGTICSPALAIE